jgi:hypothetical protein
MGNINIFLKGTYKLDGDHKNSLERKAPTAEVEQVLQGWSQELHDEGVVLPAWSEVVHFRNTL